MDAILIGYFPKRTAVRPPWVHADSVEEIASVSECISPGPSAQNEHWSPNEFGFFDSPAVAHAVLGDDAAEFDIYAYQLYPILVHQGAARPAQVTPPTVEPLDVNFHLLGYDAVSRSHGKNFECSPLSCNDAAREHEVTRDCLFANYDAALAGATEFSNGNYEPGPYYIVEVYRYDRKLAHVGT
ncbi:MAG: hypothetical protein R2873_17830 [Caldilineaceae bacterium]|nr:hypothetical protein [Caldilineaceae bacterium]